MVRCLIRLIEPTAGEISIAGEDITRMSDKELIQFRRSKVAMVFQHYGLMPHRNVLDNAAWGLEVQGVRKEDRYPRTKEVLDLVGSGRLGKTPTPGNCPAGCSNGWGWPAH